jgi:hypothetical protein
MGAALAPALTTSPPLSQQGPPYNWTSAISAGSVSAGATVAVIVVELTTITFDSATDPVFTLTPIWVAKQESEALAGVVKPLPVMTMS